MTIKALQILGFLIILGVFAWLFFWPIIECIYAQSLTPLLSDSYKLGLWIVGGLVIVIGFIKGWRMLI